MSAPRAAVDCGSNSTRLLVDDGAGTTRVRELTITRLGQGVDDTGELADDAMHRTIDAIRWYEQRWLAHDVPVERVRIAATSAVRDAANAEDFLAQVHDHTGVTAEVLSGDEEAALAFAGATADLDDDGPVAVVDIGGGSTEVVVGRRDGDVVGHSMQLGSVRLAERHLHDDPPTDEQVAEGREHCGLLLTENARVLADRGVDLAEVVAVVGVAGTVTTIAALAAGHGAWEDGAVHGLELATDDVRRVVAELLASTTAERAERDAIQRGREDVIHAGGLVLEAFLVHHDLDGLRVSEADILDGLLRSIG